MANFNRITIARLAYFPMLFFTGIGLSLGMQMGVAGVGLNELFLLFTMFWFIFVMPQTIKAWRDFFAIHQITISCHYLFNCFLFDGLFYWFDL